MEVTLRLDIVARALSLTASRGGINTSVTTFQELHHLAAEILDSCLTWGKFALSGGLRSCPNLASSNITALHTSPDVEPIVDLEDCVKKIKVARLADDTTWSSDNLELGNSEPPEPQLSSGAGDAKEGQDVYLEYKKGGSDNLNCSSHLPVPGFMYDALLLLASKEITRRGDGKANIAMWKILLPDFFAHNHVSRPEKSGVIRIL